MISLALLLPRWPAPLALVMGALPLLAGICGVWWEVRQEVVRPQAERMVEHAMLAGTTATGLPGLFALSMVIGHVWLAWRAGALAGLAVLWVVGQALLQFAGVILGLGIVVGTLGAAAAVWLTRVASRWHHGGVRTPPARR